MREKKHTREGAVGVRERGIYIYIYIISVRERGAVGVRWCCRFKNKERGEERRTKKQKKWNSVQQRKD